MQHMQSAWFSYDIVYIQAKVYPLKFTLGEILPTKIDSKPKYILYNLPWERSCLQKLIAGWKIDEKTISRGGGVY